MGNNVILEWMIGYSYIGIYMIERTYINIYQKKIYRLTFGGNNKIEIWKTL